ncbi:hypothetical protein AAG570_013086 [Ranatra chinensis]|uniref:PFU domain-containing protein n=1 Tax=Ranatra chinensis TaxID=642074 RepID=A0ABD0Z1Z9_9HEMI
MCCYKWSAVKSMWEEVGDVVGACKSPSTENKVMHDGKEYDYVFNIDLEDNKPPIKLPYNTCDDPWAVAQEFINVHRLSQGYLAQIATFISTNAVKRPSETVASSTLMDPYTGNLFIISTSGYNNINITVEV